MNEHGIVSKLEKINKEELDDELKMNLAGIFKVINTIDNKANKSDSK